MDDKTTDFSKVFHRFYCPSIGYLLPKRKQPRKGLHRGLSRSSSCNSPYDFVISESPMFSRNTKPRKMARSELPRDCRSSGSDSGIGSIKDSDLVEICSSQDRFCKKSNTSVSGNRDSCGHEGFSVRTNSSSNLNISKYKEKKKGEETCSFDDVFDKDLDYDSDSYVSVTSNPKTQCTRCGCIPKFSWTRNRVRKSNSFSRKARSSTSWSRTDKDSIFKEFASRYGDTCSEDDDRCLLNVLYADHICIDSDFCNRKSLAALNGHLKNLIDCMPQPCCDKGPERTNYSNCELEKAGYIPYRRNAVCETSEESRMKFYHALCSFMTLKALVRYDFL